MEGVNDGLAQYNNSSIKAIAQLADSQKVGEVHYCQFVGTPVVPLTAL